MPLSPFPPPHSDEGKTAQGVEMTGESPQQQQPAPTSSEPLLGSASSHPASSLPHNSKATTASRTQGTNTPLPSAPDDSITVPPPKIDVSIPATTATTTNHTYSPTNTHSGKKNTDTTVIFWPIQEPLRALWDDEGRLGFGWIDYEDDRVSGREGWGEEEKVKDGEGVRALRSTPADADPSPNPHLHRRTRIPETHANTNARVCVAGVFPPRTSFEEAKEVLRRVLDSEEASQARSGSGMAEKKGKGRREWKEDEGSEREEVISGSGSGRAGISSEPEVFDLRCLGSGEAAEGERTEVRGKRGIQIVLYDRYESGSLRYWEVDDSTSSSGLEPEVDAPLSHSRVGPRESRGSHRVAPAGRSPQPRVPSQRQVPGSDLTLKRMSYHLNSAPRLSDLVYGKRVRMYRPAAAVVLAVFGAVLRPVLGVLSVLIMGLVGSKGSSGRTRAERREEGEKEEGVTRAVGRTAREGARKLAKMSAVAKQVRVRARQVDGLVRGVDELTQVRWEGKGGVEEYVGVYNRFFNALWLILNDLTLGIAVGSFLLENARYLAGGVDAWVKTSKDALPAALVWLDSWPAGLKLNSDLSRFYVRVLGVCVAQGGPAALLLRVIPPISTPVLLKTVGYVSSVFGLSFLLALVVDVGVGLGCGGVTVGYAVARVGYVVAKEALGGLGALFRGKRYNALRHRMDAHDYDIDQLLFGTMLFTLVAFLSPTAVAFYFLFAGARLLTLLVQACLETVLAFINTFPLFLLVLKIKDSKRIPASIILLPLSSSDLVRLRILQNKSEADKMHQSLGVTGVLRLESQPRGVGWVFGTYRRLGEKLVRHYNPGRLGVGLVRGVWMGGLEG